MNRLVLAECKKIFFLKSSRRNLLALIIASQAFGALLALTTRMTTGRHFSELRPDEALSMTLLGVDLANIMLIVFTAISIHREFADKSIQVFLSLTPARMRFLTAKLLTFFGLSSVVSVITVSLAYLLSQLLLAIYGMPPLSLGEANTMQMAAGVMAMPVFYSLITVAAVFAFGSSAGAITFALGLLATQAVVGILPEGVQSILLPITPQAAIHNLAGMSPPGSLEAVSTLASVAVLIAWTLAATLTAAWKLDRRDV